MGALTFLSFFLFIFFWVKMSENDLSEHSTVVSSDLP